MVARIKPPPVSDKESSDTKLNLFVLPNLMTAGNLFCGFLALTHIVESDPAREDFNQIIVKALLLILLACFFDLLDGRVARMGGLESPFGREFDSIADIVSFGVAPAFLVHKVVLKDVFVNYQEIGWFISSVYLICGALRLARFNVMAAQPESGSSREFVGFPIPAAAGLVASLTLFLMWWEDKGFSTGQWRYVLPVLMVFLSAMMISEVRYPSFKRVGFPTARAFHDHGDGDFVHWPAFHSSSNRASDFSAIGIYFLFDIWIRSLEAAQGQTPSH